MTLKKSLPVSPNPNANIIKASERGKKISIMIPMITIKIVNLIETKF